MLTEVYPTLGESDCERITAGLLAQPINTVSSLSYLAVAIGLLIWAGRTGHWSSGLAWYAALLATVGIGSVDFHGVGTPIAQWLHDLPIVALLILGVVTPAVRWRRGQSMFPGAGPIGLGMIGIVAGAGLLAFVLGGTGSALCRPDDLWQFHALWHILTAVVLGGWAVALYVGTPKLVGHGTPER